MFSENRLCVQDLHIIRRHRWLAAIVYMQRFSSSGRVITTRHTSIFNCCANSRCAFSFKVKTSVYQQRAERAIIAWISERAELPSSVGHTYGTFKHTSFQDGFSVPRRTPVLWTTLPQVTLTIGFKLLPINLRASKICTSTYSRNRKNNA